MEWYLKKNILPLYDDISADNPLVLICDGHSSHFTIEVLDLMIENHVILILRPPHTSQVIQGKICTSISISIAAFVILLPDHSKRILNLFIYIYIYIYTSVYTCNLIHIV